MNNNAIANQGTSVMLNRQRLFIKYVFAIIIDLTVFNLFKQYWDHVFVASFSVSLISAILIAANYRRGVQGGRLLYEKRWLKA